MDCDDCNQGIEGTYFEVNGGKPVCKKCYEVNKFFLISGVLFITIKRVVD